MKYNIFGKIYQIEYEDAEIQEILEKELSLYPSEASVDADVHINFINSPILEKVVSVNPRTHKTFVDGFWADLGYYNIAYQSNHQVVININIQKRNKFISRLRSIEYQSSQENAGQILHEMALIPSLYFFNDRAILHASSFKNSETGEGVLIGGTGGVGKTSLELYYCRDKKYSFISDDIAVIDGEQNLYPNLAYPKIYAYNVEAYADLEKSLFGDSSWLDKIQWQYRKFTKGPTKARRKISPSKLYSKYENMGQKADKYYLLFKGTNLDKIEIENIDPHLAAILSLRIVQNEYQVYNQHLIWHEYNSILMDQDPIIRMEDVHSHWLTLYKKAFTNMKCFQVKIPMNMKHHEFLQQVKDSDIG